MVAQSRCAGQVLVRLANNTSRYVSLCTETQGLLDFSAFNEHQIWLTPDQSS